MRMMRNQNLVNHWTVSQFSNWIWLEAANKIIVESTPLGSCMPKRGGNTHDRQLSHASAIVTVFVTCKIEVMKQNLWFRPRGSGRMGNADMLRLNNSRQQPQRKQKDARNTEHDIILVSAWDDRDYCLRLATLIHLQKLQLAWSKADDVHTQLSQGQHR